MNLEEQEDQAAVSEQAEVSQQDTPQDEPKMVPLAALQAERRKRQEFETRTKVYEDLLAKKNVPTEEV